jgi:hypothetical protein
VQLYWANAVMIVIVNVFVTHSPPGQSASLRHGTHSPTWPVHAQE